MVGVAQNDLRLDLVAHVADMAGLHRARRAYRHEDGRFNRAVASVQDTRTGVAFQIVRNNVEVHRFIFAQKYDFFPNIFPIFAIIKNPKTCISFFLSIA
jgi:hypothetical protein